MFLKFFVVSILSYFLKTLQSYIEFAKLQKVRPLFFREMAILT